MGSLICICHCAAGELITDSFLSSCFGTVYPEAFIQKQATLAELAGFSLDVSAVVRSSWAQAAVLRGPARGPEPASVSGCGCGSLSELARTPAAADVHAAASQAAGKPARVAYNVKAC